MAVSLTEIKAHCRVAHEDDDAALQHYADASANELARYIGGDLPEPLPADLGLAIMEMVAHAYDYRADPEAKPGLTPAAARIAARYKPVSAGTAL